MNKKDEDDPAGSDESEDAFDEGDELFMSEQEKALLQEKRRERAIRQKDRAAARDRKGISYERLTEFFFDLCLSWCQFLDIETFLFFINGVFLNITKGGHLNTSQFKADDEIEVLSIEFINHLLAYRSICQERVSNGQSYGEWYELNFGRTHAVISNVEKNLLEAFKSKSENRILDIWLELPPQIVNHFIN